MNVTIIPTADIFKNNSTDRKKNQSLPRPDIMCTSEEIKRNTMANSPAIRKISNPVFGMSTWRIAALAALQILSWSGGCSSGGSLFSFSISSFIATRTSIQLGAKLYLSIEIYAIRSEKTTICACKRRVGGRTIRTELGWEANAGWAFSRWRGFTRHPPKPPTGEHNWVSQFYQRSVSPTDPNGGRATAGCASARVPARPSQ